MSQILEQEVTQSDEYYKKEIRRMIKEMQFKNEQMDKTQLEIEKFQKRSAETLKRIDNNIQKIENILITL